MRLFRRQKSDTDRWCPPEGYRLVFDPFHSRYTDGFDRDRLYTFIRVGSDDRQVFKLSDQSPHFNIAGLYYRELPACLQV